MAPLLLPKTLVLKQTIKSNSLVDGYREFPLKVAGKEVYGSTTLGKNSEPEVNTAAFVVEQNADVLAATLYAQDKINIQ